MLADFPVAVDLDGERVAVVCRDVSTAAFFYGFPNVPLGSPCDEAAGPAERRRNEQLTEHWALGLLTRAAVVPRLTPELVERMADAALDLIVGYFYAVGWLTRPDLDLAEAQGGALARAARRYAESLGAFERERLPAPAAPAPTFAGDHRPLITEMAPNVRRAVRDVARRARVLPAALWLSPISEFILNWRTLMTADEDDPAGVTWD